MNDARKKKEIKRFQLRLKKEMPRILKEIEVYEIAVREGNLKKNPKPAPPFNLD